MSIDAKSSHLAGNASCREGGPAPGARSPSALRKARIVVFLLFVAAAAWAAQPSRALAACVADSPVAGTTTCSGDPNTFPSGGAAAQGGNTTLNVNSLTNNITPASGVAGAGVVIAPGPAGNGTSLPVHGLNGDSGSNSPDVTINLQGAGSAFQVNTNNGFGIIAQSIGQTGGQGGTGFGALVLLVPVPGIGGNGGQGGNGGNVNVTTIGTGTVSTTGTNQHAIFALSQGGVGGAGGNGDTFVSVGVGGNGANGGAPGTVTVNNVLNLNTTGTGAAGIWAQSVGAAGGAAGSADGLNIAGIGGTGAAASTGQAVNVTNNSAITTHGNGALGIFAQSVGGYSGSGGGSIGLFSFGGNSSSAGSGGNVTVQTDGGSITTSGVGSTAIFAQSAGGGGGAGGAGGGLVGFGGGGSTGGNGQTVTVTNNAVINVSGDLSSGVFAQSFGGGGGTAGFGAGVVGIGGNGGGGGNGGDVSVTNNQKITVGGSGSFNPGSGTAIDAAGIYAQSVGGGGGNGALGAGVVGVGGTGGAAGNGGNVTVTNNADITHANCPNCTEAPTIFAQSVGGGGGDGGASGGVVSVGGNGSGGGAGGNVTVNNNGNLTAYGSLSPALFAQSVGGGGGNGGFALAAGAFVSVGVGGQGGTGGAGGTVCVNADGACTSIAPGLAATTIQTIGDRSAGIFAQSVGGGGGSGGGTLSVSGGVFGSLSVAVGGPGGAGGASQNVFVGANGAITTQGDFSPGIQAQSVAGGGGSGGFAISLTGGATYASAAISVGGGGGTGAAAGSVTVDSTTDITTQGHFSPAINAMSVGGGGGNGGFAISGSGSIGASLNFGFGGGGGSGADGGVVNVTSVGTLRTGVQNSDIGDNSAAIFAASIGGSGGSGGFTVGAGGAMGGSLNATFGGGGGNGANGRSVTVNNNNAATASTNSITTYSALSDGIFAESVGGSGGSGGFAVSAGGAQYASVQLSFGGTGGAGGNGDAVNVTSYGAITTFGDKSNGIFAQSVGGGGGNGGFAASAGGAQFGAVSLGLGGGGAQGGSGGKVTVANTGAITTSGAQSNGIFAQSVGGGGGNGGLAIGLAGSEYASLGIALGGPGANGGVGDAVKVDSVGAITTTGDQSNGIFAQSIGGAGGNGGAAISGTLTVETGFSGNLSMAVGGTAGDGAAGGAVHVGNNGDITTSGLNADAILAQSIGGSGGNGGLSGAINLAGGGVAFTSSVGGKAGSGSNGGAVDVASAGDLTTQGANSVGILAQSVGGGGGNGGASLLLAASYEGTSGPTPKTVGGGGGSGGEGGAVTVTSNGTVTTSGALSDGILAQSVGGGGGRGGFSIGASLSYSGSTDINSVGGGGGTGNNAAQVSVTATAGSTGAHPGFSVYTTGDNSVGILAQSIGGGGGVGGFSIAGSLNAGGDANGSTVGGSGAGAGSSLNISSFGNPGYVAAVQVSNTGNIFTGGRNSSGIEAQSVGGGGGDGGFSIGASGTISDSNSKLQAVGGAGGASGNGGDVIVDNNNTANSRAVIITAQDLSYGILAQSVGGGGGNGGFAIAGSLSTSGGAEANATGGNGGGGGNGGRVAVTSGGGIFTGATISGDNIVASGAGQGSAGVVAQSVGGGGGAGGFAGGLALAFGDKAKNSIGGGNGGVGGTGGVVDVTMLEGSAIVTFGDNASGIVAQSVGGGGGNGGFSIGASFASNADSASNSVGGSGGVGGASSAVTVNNAANITTAGLLSNGIVAQSVGGGGGNGGFAVSGSLSLGGDAESNSTGGNGGGGGNAGTVTVNNSGDIRVNQASTIGILAQSVGGGGGNGAFAGGISFSTSGDTKNTVGGGGGGLAGDGSTVMVTNLGNVTANGDQGVGIFAQSVGGGGGNGGFSIGAGASTSAGSETQIVGGGAGGGGKGGDVTVANGASTNTGATVTTNGAMAYGIVAQSVGGGGGNGGFAIGGNLALGGDAKSTIGGGAGGAGGNAGVVTVDNFAHVVTNGVQSTGILAQSVGGGGGSGGFAGSLSFSSGGDVNNSVGGANGGLGGTPSNVNVTNHAAATIETNEANSIGILAQAIGGGGGQGGFSISGGVSTSGNSVVQSIGGAGGTGGSSAGTLVTVENDGQIITHKANSIGIFAQNVGGGGGVGGVTVAGTFGNGGGANGTSATVGGGAGGAGGNAGDVKVINNGAITTFGANSIGVVAQSVGGGGGAASFSGAFNFSGSGNLTNTVGGGGNGGNGGNVTVINKGSIITLGQDSVAIMAQSIGGGGGSSLFSIGQWTNSLTSDIIALGSSGSGSQGAQGTVNVDISGGITVSTGDLSYGLLGQSIGAGGGNAALSVPDPLTVGAGGLTQTLGASGSSSGDGAAATYANSNPTATFGAGAIGFIGQSIGGGGGTSGVTGDATFMATGSFSQVLGGSTSGGGNGGALTLTNTAAAIQTGGDPLNPASGDAAVGVLGQSIGGGGGSAITAISVSQGNAGLLSQTVGGSEGAGGNGGQLLLTSGGQILTLGRFAPGLVGQSIGGGGGFSAITFATGTPASGVTFQLGSTGGAGGSADPSQGSKWTINAGSINTTGVLSDGLVAQAIGAGGGLAGFVSDGAQNPPLTAVQLGARAGVGNGSAVTFDAAGVQSAITTLGAGANGLIAQSIGGGGGVAQAFGVSGSGPVTLGATGGASGNGGDVSFITQQAISTTGVYAHAIVAQSIGGGGGLFQAFDSNGNPLSLNLQAGAGGGGGNGGNVNVTSNGAIGTIGAGAHGIVAQSVAGGGGIVGGGVFATGLPTTTTGFAGSAGGVGTAGTVSVNSQADILTLGSNATAVFAESIDRTGLGGNIAVTLGNAARGTDQLTIGGAGAGNGVAFVGGSSNAAAPNTLTNYSTLTTTSPLQGMTITGALGDEAVTNFGHLIGSVDLVGAVNRPGEVNTIDNKPYRSALNPTPFSGIFDSGANIILSQGAAPAAANLFTNEGLLSTGAFLNVFTTNEAGNFAQTVTGSCGSFGNPTATCGYMGVDLDLKPQTADRLNVTGTASVSGAIVVDIMNPGYAATGNHHNVIVHADGGETHPSLILQSQPSAVATYSLSYTPTDILLNYGINFAPAGLTVNQSSVGNAINQIQTVRLYPGFAPIAAALFYQPTVQQLGMVYDSLSGEGVSASQQASFQSTELFQTSVAREMQFWLLDDERSDPNAVTLFGDQGLARASSAETSDRGFIALVPTAVYRLSPPRTWRAWAIANGGTAQYPAEPYYIGSAPSRAAGAGFATGLDYQIGSSAIVGLAAGYGKFSFNVANRETNGTTEGEHFAAYGMLREGNAYASGILGGDFFDNREVRHAFIPGTTLPPLFGTPIPSVPGFNENPGGKFGSNAISGAFEVGYRNRLGWLDVTPFADFQFSVLHQYGFTESQSGGPSMLALNFSSRTIPSIPTLLGLWFNAQTEIGDGMMLGGWLRTAWKHEFDSRRSIQSAFFDAPGFDFTIDGARAVRDAARLNAGLRFAVNKYWMLFAGFDSDLAPHGRTIGGTGGVRVSW